MKPGRKPNHGITTGMYFDYCIGLTIDEVAQKWGCGATNVRRRFGAMQLPLRRANRGSCGHCLDRSRNPHDVRGLSFDDANRARTRLANVAMCERASAALEGAPNPYARGILQLRVDHPGATLSELAALHDPPLSRDAVSGVLRRARALAATA